jgi:gliding motility-associated-like protein
MRKQNLIFIFFLVIASSAIAQGEIWIKPNKGQWHQNIKYLIKTPGGEMFLENSGFTFQFHNGGELMHAHNEGDGHDHDLTLQKHVVKTQFVGANLLPKFEESKPSPHVENYFLGNDETKWVSNLKLYNQVNYIDLYPGIDLNLYEHNQTLKYDILVDAGADISNYKVKYEGQETIEIIDGAIFITTSLGTITEEKPVAYQLINGLKKNIECRYVLKNNVISFDFPKGYNNSYPLVIDPVLLFSTFTGSTSDNWGMTACPDVNDQLIAAGIVFGGGYPTSTGVISTGFNGGQVDIGLTKFNPTGTGIVFSTYIGGTGSETPHSVIVNDLNQIFLMGATSSSNFPIPSTGYQTSFQGGNSITVDGINFFNGTDIFVLKINPNGSTIFNGTYIGGSGNDGISNPNSTVAGSAIAYNYGDQLRGEIIVGPNSTVYISSTTGSVNFPIVSGFSSILGGAQDAVFVKLNNTLSNIMYSTYVGGSGLESGNSIQLSSAGDLFMAGGTTSSNFPFTTGQVNPSYLGGSTDGYVIKLEGPNYTNPKATYLGTNQYDQSYFVQLDLNDKVYVYGQTEGAYPVSAGKYNNPNSGQFIHKLNNNLTVSEWSSVFGASSGTVEISPTAFLVSDCYEIYVAGWGGNINTNNASPTGSTTSGFPLTPDAYQNTTSGSNFWLGLFDPDMNILKYATFMGNTTHSASQGDHVDGGTSRFSKGGKIFHAVCAACQGLNNGFPTTPGAYSSTNSSPNCNMAAFVFDLSKIEAALGAPVAVTCLPNATNFTNTSTNGNTYTWFFGDGDSAVAFAPSHLYPGPGTYDVMLIVSDSNGCYTPDTAYTQVEIILPVYEAYAFEDTICPGTQVQLQATGGTNYLWSPPALFNNPNLQSPIGTISTDTTISVEITSVCGTTTLNVDVWVFDVITDSGGDTSVCIGSSVPITASGGGQYLWTPGFSLNDSTIANPSASPNIDTYYQVFITTPDGCLDTNYVLVQVDPGLPTPTLPPDDTICLGDDIRLVAAGANTYNWQPNYNISSLNAYNPLVWPDVTTTYFVSFSNSCGSNSDSVTIYVKDIFPTIRPDTAVCPFEPVVLYASGGTKYSWTPTLRVENPLSASTVVRPSKTTWYTVEVSDDIGCSDTIGFLIDVFDLPKLTISDDVYAVQGDEVPIWAQGDGTIQWYPDVFINCPNCFETEVYPPKNANYTAVLTDFNGCEVRDEVSIFYSPLIYVPNAFTPDGNNFNNVFKAVTNNIVEFEMTIYNRWGEIVFVTNDTEGSWNGYYGGKLAQDGVYVWKIHYTDLNGERELMVGHVSLLR